MTNYLVTGASGFVGKYLIERILATEPESMVVGTDMSVSSSDANELEPRLKTIVLDLLDRNGLDEVIHRWEPAKIIHLASHSSVAFSWQDPVDSFLNNTNIFLNLIESVKRNCPSSRILSVGSSEEYGVVGLDELPLKETRPLRPTSPYGVARASQEMLSQVYTKGFGLDLVITRSFNHVGPRQRETFFIPGLVKQFAVAKAAGVRKVEILAGDMKVIRDFTDVRDVVRAYLLLLQCGRTGEIYNVCSGKGYLLEEVVKMLEVISGIKANIVIDPTRIRPVENPVIIGDNQKLRAECGWHPRYDLATTLGQILDYYHDPDHNIAIDDSV